MQLRSRYHALGFTLIELLITMAIAIILLTLALPSFRELMIRNNVTQTTNALVHDLTLARSEAVRRGSAVQVVSTSGGANWSSGWSIKAGATTIQKSDGVPADYAACAKATGAASSSAVTFNSLGVLGGATALDINVIRPDGNTSESQHVGVSISGQVSSNKIGATTPVAPTSC